MKNINVSVLLCVYNGELYIQDALESLSFQTYKDFEIIIVNDGSTDDTLKIVEEFIVNNINIDIKLFTNVNQGLTKSLNFAIEKSSGDYIARMDADDLCCESRLEDSLYYLSNNNLDFISTMANTFVTNDEVLKIIPNFIGRKTVLDSRLLKFGNPYVHGTFFGKSIVFKDLMYCERFRTAQDYDFICRLFKSEYKIGFLEKPLYWLRLNPSSIGRMKGSLQNTNAELIAQKHFGSKLYLIVSKKGIVKKTFSILKLFYFIGIRVKVI